LSSEQVNKVDLYEFLAIERKTSQEFNNTDRETKVVLSYPNVDIDSYYELQKREIIIKTKMIAVDDDIIDQNPLYIHIFIDTTQISQLEEAKAKNKYQRQMLANVSHEFRTPLNAMMMSLVLMKDTINKPNEKFLKIASASSNMLASLVEDILDHAKIETGVFEIQDTIFVFDELFSEINDIFELQARIKKIHINFKVDDLFKNKHVVTDKQRIKQVCLNLISNALKFTDQGSITIELTHSYDEDIKEQHNEEQHKEENKEENKIEEQKIEEHDQIENDCDNSYVNDELTKRHKINSTKSYLFMGDHSKEEIQPLSTRSLHKDDFKV
jgi:signal transduction histidine kinase